MEKMNDEELNIVNGGAESGAGYYLTVGNCNEPYLALRPEPVWDQYHELAQLWPGYQVFTYGATTNGTGLYGVPCRYTYVQFNGIWDGRMRPIYIKTGWSPRSLTMTTTGHRPLRI